MEQEKTGKFSKIKDFFTQPMTLWLVVIMLAISFLGGAATTTALNAASATNPVIIKGVVAEATSTNQSGTVNLTVDLPSYLKKDVDFSLFWSVWNLLKQKSYATGTPETQLFYGALQGMVASLGDPYSVFMTPTDATEFSEDLKGNFEGIGAEIAVKNNKLIIVSPLDDSPALKAGLKPKDWIVKINGTSTQDMSSNEAVTLIRGKAGTKVILTIYRDGFSATKDFEITRAAINVKSVSWEYVNNGSTVRIKVRQFNDDTTALFDQAIKEFTAKPNVKNIILDLRGNPGGYLDAAIAMAGEWNGYDTVVREKDRNGVETRHIAYKTPRLADYKTVVLVDGGSASASEIVAGALKDWNKAKLVGVKTFGKGSVQELDGLPDGSQVKLTIAKWFTPSGNTIDEQGIEPDVKVELTDTQYNNDEDPQLDKAIELSK